MKVVDKHALVPYQAAQMFALVDDINLYPQFLPWCLGSEVLLRQTDLVEAKLWVGNKTLKKAFVTRNYLYPNERIELTLLEGPFKHLEGQWQFHALGDDGCKVDLHLEFEFASKILDAAFASVFNKVTQGLMKAFCARAEQSMANKKINIEIVYANSAEQQFFTTLELTDGVMIKDAINASKLLETHPDLIFENLAVGIFSKKANLETVLKDGDRLEIYRPLLIDPKQARRERSKKK